MPGVRWLRSADGLVGQGYVLPRKVLEAVIDFRAGALRTEHMDLDHRHMNFLAEDGAINLWAMAHGRHIYSTVPALVAQRSDCSSLYDHDGDWARRSVCGIHEPAEGREATVDVGRTHSQHSRHLLLTIRREHWRRLGVVERYYDLMGGES